MITKHWLREDEDVTCCGKTFLEGRIKIAKTYDETTCKNCIRFVDNCWVKPAKEML